MNALQTAYQGIEKCRTKYLQFITYKAELRNIEKKKELWSKTILSASQEKEIKEYWKSISGYNISTKWHRLYQSYCGVYNKKYFPELLYTTKLERILSPPKYYDILSDKGLITSIFSRSDCRLPKTIIWKCGGVLTDGYHHVVTVDYAKKALNNCGRIILKPTRYSSSGNGVRLLQLIDGIDKVTGDTVSNILSESGENCIFQECVEQSPFLSKLYSGSLNTFRIITYICEGKVFLAPLAMRIGSGGSYVDNIHAGGLCIGIDKNFALRKYAFCEMGQRYEQHPDTHVVFNGYSIPSLKNVTDIAMDLHGRIPQVKMISWDWSVDQNEMPVLIEINISGQAVWFPQMLNGESLFGEQTEFFANLIKRGCDNVSK